MTATDETKALLRRVYESFNTGDPSVWTDSLSKDVVGIGSDPDEWWEGSDVVARVGEQQTKQMSEAGIRVAGGSAQIFSDGNVTWAVDNPVISLHDGTSTSARFTLVATRDEDELKIRHFHLSFGVANVEVIGEELPTR